MKRSAALLTALSLSAGASLSQGQTAQAMNIAWDCFDRSTEALVARSAIDITSPAISCQPAVGAGSQQAGNNTDHHSEDVIEISHEETVSQDEEFGFEDDSLENNASQEDANDFSDEDWGQIDDGSEDIIAEGSDDSPSTGGQLGQALGDHLGKLIGQGLADLFN